MNIELEKLRAGTNATDSDSGLEVARKINKNFDNTVTAIQEMDKKINGIITENDLLILDGNPK